MSSWFRTPTPKAKEPSDEVSNLLNTASKILNQLVTEVNQNDPVLDMAARNQSIREKHQKERKEEADRAAHELEIVAAAERSKAEERKSLIGSVQKIVQHLGALTPGRNQRLFNEPNDWNSWNRGSVEETTASSSSTASSFEDDAAEDEAVEDDSPVKRLKKAVFGRRERKEPQPPKSPEQMLEDEIRMVVESSPIKLKKTLDQLVKDKRFYSLNKNALWSYFEAACDKGMIAQTKERKDTKGIPQVNKKPLEWFVGIFGGRFPQDDTRDSVASVVRDLLNQPKRYKGFFEKK